MFNVFTKESIDKIVEHTDALMLKMDMSDWPPHILLQWLKTHVTVSSDDEKWIINSEISGNSFTNRADDPNKLKEFLTSKKFFALDDLEA